MCGGAIAAAKFFNVFATFASRYRGEGLQSAWRTVWNHKTWSPGSATLIGKISKQRHGSVLCVRDVEQQDVWSTV